jgi:uncharacterized integral membrane protein
VEQSQPDKRNTRRWLLIGGGALLFLVLVLNSQSVEVNFIFATAQMPLFFALALAAALGALVGWAAPRLRRSKD